MSSTRPAQVSILRYRPRRPPPRAAKAPLILSPQWSQLRQRSLWTLASCSNRCGRGFHGTGTGTVELAFPRRDPMLLAFSSPPHRFSRVLRPPRHGAPSPPTVPEQRHHQTPSLRPACFAARGSTVTGGGREAARGSASRGARGGGGAGGGGAGGGGGSGGGAGGFGFGGRRREYGISGAATARQMAPAMSKDGGRSVQRGGNAMIVARRRPALPAWS